MLKKLLKENMGTSNLGWLESRFHFSFAEYRNPKNISFGVLRVINDDIIHPKSGFETHPHANIEIVSYIIKGEITHKDSMGNEETLKRGEVQYLSAGEGIFHSEHNPDQSKDLRLLQIWILPPKQGLERLYGSHKFKAAERKNKLLHIVSNKDAKAAIKLHQDVNFYVSELDKSKSIRVELQAQRQIYFVQIEGKSNINGVLLQEGDALEITQENKLLIQAVSSSHFLFIEMAKS